MHRDKASPIQTPRRPHNLTSSLFTTVNFVNSYNREPRFITRKLTRPYFKPGLF